MVAACLSAFALGSVHPSPPRPLLLAPHAPRPLLAHHALLRVRGGAAHGREHRAAHALGSDRRELRQRLELRERRERRARRRAMYASCCGIVVLWIGGGTLFYSLHNQWPPSQAFFYAVDAGMSIGFCTAIAETSVSSRAFTVVYILLGASVVGGALALFVEVSQSVTTTLLAGSPWLFVEDAVATLTLTLPLILTLTLPLTLTPALTLVLILHLTRTPSRARPARAVPSTAASS